MRLLRLSTLQLSAFPSTDGGASTQLLVSRLMKPQGNLHQQQGGHSHSHSRTCATTTALWYSRTSGVGGVRWADPARCASVRLPGGESLRAPAALPSSARCAALRRGIHGTRL